MIVNGVKAKILRLLSDGMPHSREEILRECLHDELGARSNVAVHICHLRKLLPKTETIVCEHVGRRQTRYRHVRLLASAVDGKS